MQKQTQTSSSKVGLRNALVVGGESSFVASKLSKSLLRHGIHVADHVDWTESKPPRRISTSIDLIYICTDMVGHSLSEPCMNLARQSGIPYVNGTRKWAESVVRLAQAGFPLIQQEVKEEVEVEEQIKEVEAPQEAAESEQVTVSEVAPSDTIIINTSKEEATMSNNISSNNVSSGNVSSGKIERFSMNHHKQRCYLHGLIRNPTATNGELWNIISVQPELMNCTVDYTRAKIAREQLGISVAFHGDHRIVEIDREKFADTAIALGENDCKIPDQRYDVPVLLHTSNKAQEAKFPSEPVEVKEVAVEAAVEKKASKLSEIIIALRAAMKAEGYVELTITQDKEVKFKQIKIAEGTLAL